MQTELVYFLLWTRVIFFSFLPFFILKVHKCVSLVHAVDKVSYVMELTLIVTCAQIICMEYDKSISFVNNSFSFDDSCHGLTSQLVIRFRLLSAYLPAATKLGQGYVFTGTCHSVNRGEYLTRYTPWDQVHPPCRACWEIWSMHRQYASYWNAILFDYNLTV